MLIMVPIFLIGALDPVVGLHLREGGHQPRCGPPRRRRPRCATSGRKGEVKLLLVRNVDVSYDDVQVLFNVNFEIDEGEIVALLGTNGAGKSTLLKAIAGVVPADGGAIVFDGRDATYAPPHEIAARGIVHGPGRSGRVPVADRRGEPAAGGLARP